jgi:cysteine-rich repeat protein
MKYLLALSLAACQNELPIFPGSGSELIVVCGDGVTGAGEACDDGNQSDFDACTAACTNAACGDGVTRRDINDPLEAGYEACDDGNDRDDDSCTNRCKSPVCGDGRQLVGVEPGEAAYEQCDDGNRIGSDGCTNDCLAARCGDGIIRRSAESEADLEECDDGNAVDTDGCRNNCQIARCGDGVQRFEFGSGERSSCNEHDDCEGGRCVGLRCYAAGFEGCDDGNDDESDGCLNGCAAARCGDGIIRSDTVQGDNGFEVCDDGNDDDSDGCNGQCQEARCGDGVRRSDLDPLLRGPNATCELGCHENEVCSGTLCIPESYEACDDGNENASDACVECKVPGSSPASAASSCRHLLAQNMLVSGSYWLDFDGAGDLYEPALFYCDQENNGGGWLELWGPNAPINHSCDWLTFNNLYDNTQFGVGEFFAQLDDNWVRTCTSLGLLLFRRSPIRAELRIKLTAPIEFTGIRFSGSFLVAADSGIQIYKVPTAADRSFEHIITNDPRWTRLDSCEEITVDETIETFSERGNAAAWGIRAYSPSNGCPNDVRLQISRLAIR